MCGCGQITIGGVDGGECDAPVKFPWPSDVDALKARVALQVDALDLGVKSCAGLTAEDRAAWELFVGTWRAFAKKETPVFGAYGEWVTACSYAHTVDAWREKIASKCSSVPGPNPIHGAETAASTVKWVSAAVLAVAVVGGGIYVARMVRG
ncbi:MAG TPA: hypothetical protein VM925_21800 [Labilithrix sp.]|nr:hypothetical protein [Labilithrix sp.]